MTDGYREYYLCGDKSLVSQVRDDVLKHSQFEMPPIHLLDRLRTLSDIFIISDPYYVMVITDEYNNPLSYRVETNKALRKEHIISIENVGFIFESIIPHGEMMVIYINETGV